MTLNLVDSPFFRVVVIIPGVKLVSFLEILFGGDPEAHEQIMTNAMGRTRHREKIFFFIILHPYCK